MCSNFALAESESVNLNLVPTSATLNPSLSPSSGDVIPPPASTYDLPNPRSKVCPIRAVFTVLLYPSSSPLNSDLVDTYGPANAGADTPSASRTTANAFMSS